GSERLLRNDEGRSSKAPASSTWRDRIDLAVAMRRAIEDVGADGRNLDHARGPGRVHVVRMVVGRVADDGVHPAASAHGVRGDAQSPAARGAVGDLVGQAVAGERELAIAAGVARAFIDDAANGLGAVALAGAREDDLSHGLLADLALAAGFEIDR